jgi:copper oxidase (laccase) domain-containing protein
MALRTATVPALAAIPGLVHGFEQRGPGDGSETGEESRTRVARALDGQGRLLLLKQVHGVTVVEAPWDGTPEADASVATAPGWFLGVKTADCLPILLVDPKRRLVAAAHAGWRGTAAGVVARTVDALAARGSRPENLIAALGPGIGPCCYEVGDDLRAANARQLVDAGLCPAALHHVADCTRCRADLYHSYRRDGQRAGRMISFVGFRL